MFPIKEMAFQYTHVFIYFYCFNLAPVRTELSGNNYRPYPLSTTFNCRLLVHIFCSWKISLLLVPLKKGNIFVFFALTFTVWFWTKIKWISCLSYLPLFWSVCDNQVWFWNILICLLKNSSKTAWILYFPLAMLLCSTYTFMLDIITS